MTVTVLKFVESGKMISKRLLLLTTLFFLTSFQAPSFNNPALIFGTSFGKMMQVYYNQAKFNELMHFTSSQSIKKYGYSLILNYYKQMDFSFDIKLNSITKTSHGFQMNYVAIISATKRNFRFVVNIESDTCKLLFQQKYFKQKYLFIDN